MPRSLRILIAPTSFKGSLSARDACDIIERALRDAAPPLDLSLEIDRCPIGDGGEGTASILAEAFGAGARRATVPGPIDGEPIEAEWFRLERLADAPMLASALGVGAGPEPAAIFDAAEVGGLPRVPEGRRDPGRISTRGIGRLIQIARADGCATVVVGLGGSASIDGGIGAASALGWTFLDGTGAPLDPVGDSLARIARVVAPGAPEDGASPGVIALCDVTNPLLGAEGAARTFGPQKGASPEQVGSLELGLAGLTKRCILSGIPANPGAPGAGAAGGLGFGLATFAGATLAPGAETVLRALGADARLGRAHLVITGEGSLDAQTAHGKAIGVLLELARATGTPVAAIAGRADADAAAALGLSSVLTLADGATSPERAMAEAPGLLAARAAALLESFVARPDP